MKTTTNSEAIECGGCGERVSGDHADGRHVCVIRRQRKPWEFTMEQMEAMKWRGKPVVFIAEREQFLKRLYGVVCESFAAGSFERGAGFERMKALLVSEW